jgi:sugar phosphate isomerase/epimerase
VRTLDEARQVVSDIGAGTARYVIDVLHLMRSGDGLAGLLAVADDPRLAYLQLSDVAGPAPASPELLRAEARTARFVPGEGKAPLREILAALPPGMPISVEAPAARLAGLSPAERARILYDSVRALLEAD